MILGAARATALSGSEETTAKNIADVLNKKYPNHLWAVNVDEPQGIATVHNLFLSGQWGFLIKLNEIDNDYKAIMRAGGELLERYRLARSGAKMDRILDLKRDFTGNPIADKS